MSLIARAPARAARWWHEATDRHERELAVRDGAFGHGYLVRDGATTTQVPALVDGWPTRNLGRWVYHLHPRTRFTVSTRSEREDVRVVAIGHPVDVDAGTRDTQAIVDDLAATLRTSGSEAAIRKAAYLGGRWTVVLHQPAAAGAGSPPRPGDHGGERFTVIPDLQASQPIYYSSRGGFAFGSAPGLTAAALDLPVDAQASTTFARARELRRTGVVYFPGLITSYEDVLPVVPDCLISGSVLSATAGHTTVEHRRFWPFTDRIERTDTEAVAAEFSARMREHSRLLSGFGRVALSLTSGLDCRVALANHLPDVGEDTFAFTYLNPRSATNAAAMGDVFGANAIASRLGLQHLTLRWRQPKPDSVFEEIYRRTYPNEPGSTGAAHAMWADLPRDIVQLQSIGGEIGTVFSRMRNSDPISPRKLSILWLGEKYGNRAEFDPIFDAYLQYTQFEEPRMLGYDHHDLNYWEHRMGKWASRKFQESDFSHRLLMPYNERGIQELMLSLPEEQRISKALYSAVLARTPALISI